MYYTYILESIGNEHTIYIGSTEDLPARLNQHNSKKVTSTKTLAPWRVIYYEAHLSKTLARRAELFYKTGQGRRQLRKKLGFDEEI